MNKTIIHLLLASLLCLGWGATGFKIDAVMSEDKSIFLSFFTGFLENPEIIEASGIVSSLDHPYVLWTHNDSGDSARIFAMNILAQHLGTWYFWDVNANGGNGGPLYARDWEDIARGPGPTESDPDYLYIGDIGRNRYIVIIRVEEPQAEAFQEPVVEIVTEFDIFYAVYPDLGVYDAESMMVDPLTNDIYIIQKTSTIGSNVYRFPADQQISGSLAVLEQVTTINFGDPSLPGSPLTTGGDISPLGNEILIRTYDSAFLWPRPTGWTVQESLDDLVPTQVLLLDKFLQGEAIGYDQYGWGFLTVSEQPDPAPLFYYWRTP